MVSSICLPHPPANRIAITVMKSGPVPMPCPFFGKCDGIWVIDAGTGATEFRPNPERTPVALCDLILAARPARLICGFIGDTEKQRLRAVGIDVRLGPCACTIEELVAAFDSLAAA